MVERSVRLDEEVHDLLREIAEECDRNVTQLIRLAVNHLVGTVAVDGQGVVPSLLEYEAEATTYVDEIKGDRYNPDQW